MSAVRSYFIILISLNLVFQSFADEHLSYRFHFFFCVCSIIKTLLWGQKDGKVGKGACHQAR